jgi:hypothetical protein
MTAKRCWQLAKTCSFKAGSVCATALENNGTATPINRPATLNGTNLDITALLLVGRS